MPSVQRGEVWQIDFGLAAKVRPALVLGCDIADEDRVLVAVVYHTLSLRGSRYEVPLRVPGLDEGGFDAQSIYTVPASKLVRRRAVLNPAQIKAVEAKVKLWLGLEWISQSMQGVVPEALLNRVEHGIRCYDPCLSCSTHAVGQMPLRVQFIAADGKVLGDVTRGQKLAQATVWKVRSPS